MDDKVKMTKTLFTRRRFLAAAGAIAVMGSGLGGYTWLIEPGWMEVVRHDLPVKGLPAGLDGRILAQISDLHIGAQVSSDFIIRSLATLASLKPDLLVITGDVMTCHAGEQLQEVERVMRHCPIPPLGAYVGLGNHDYGRDFQNSTVADALSELLRGLGMAVLRNERKAVEGLQVVGLDDLWAPHFGPQSVLAEIGPDTPAIVLSHNPDAADLPVWAGYRGWILSGHTHGGQCKPPFLPPPLLPVDNRRYTAGAYDLFDGRHMYINRGLGHLTPVRINARPELTLHRLMRV